MDNLASRPEDIPAEWGYSSQTRVAEALAERVFGNTVLLWFATELNPIFNDDAANPLLIYEALDRAVKKGDAENWKIVDLKRRLRDAIEQRLGASPAAQGWSRTIESAPLEWFRPQLVRLKLENDDQQSGRRKAVNLVEQRGGRLSINEYVLDVPLGRVEIIVP